MADQAASYVSYSAPRGDCVVCSQPGLPCKRCHVDYYCGKRHQERDLERHKKGCGVVEIRCSPELGRHLVATRNIPEGTVIMREMPLVSFPRPFLLPGQMLCVVCCRQLPGKLADWKQCAACGWPVCGAMCAGRKKVHRAECRAFQRGGFKVSRADLKHMDGDWLKALAALRTCLASESLPQLSALQDDLNDADRDADTPEICPDDQVGLLMATAVRRRRVFDKTVAWLKNAGISWIPSEKLHRAVAANQTNGCCDDTTGNDVGSGGVARGSLYAGLCILERSCVPNTTSLLEVERTGQRLVMVSRDVKIGEHLSVDYQGSPFRSLSERRLDSCQRGFLCRCALCEDPTELGLYLSSPCCVRCSRRGKMAYIVDKCSECGDLKSESMTEPEVEFRQLYEQSATPHRWERFVGQFSWPKGPLHPSHHMVLHAKMQIVEALERCQMGHLSFITTHAEAVRWESVCRDVLGALEVVRPGASSYMQSVLLAMCLVCHVKGSQPSSSLVRPGTRSNETDVSREMGKILMKLEKMMIAGRAKEVLQELKEKWKESYNHVIYGRPHSQRPQGIIVVAIFLVRGLPGLLYMPR